MSALHADDLGAIPLRALMARNAGVDWQAAALILASEAAAKKYGLIPIVRVLGGAAAHHGLWSDAGLEKADARLRLAQADFDVI